MARKSTFFHPLHTLPGVFLILAFGIGAMTWCRDLKASVGHIPVLAETPEKGTFIELIKAIDEVYTEGKIIINVYPFPRSVANVIEGLADFHIPLVSDPHVNMDTMPYRFATKPMGTVCIVLYTNINKKITKDMILNAIPQKPYPYIIEMNRGNEAFYDFPSSPISEIMMSYRKLEIGRIDAFLGAQEEGDVMCRELKLKNIRRDLWEAKDDLIVIPKGKKGDEIDKILTESINTLDKNGTLKEIYSRIHLPYKEWQPYKASY
ncbi:MAG: hypothetical protein JW795_01020 [Chitinivibrionales bacterium]|nr:hypothetical protein [Chitinivibrionales bacterium]